MMQPEKFNQEIYLFNRETKLIFTNNNKKIDENEARSSQGK